jgi:hypothetical protein
MRVEANKLIIIKVIVNVCKCIPGLLQCTYNMNPPTAKATITAAMITMPAIRPGELPEFKNRKQHLHLTLVICLFKQTTVFLVFHEPTLFEAIIQMLNLPFKGPDTAGVFIIRDKPDFSDV